MRNIPVIFSPVKTKKLIEPLKWDGSLLGKFSPSTIGLKIAVEKGLTIRSVETKTFRTMGALKASRNTSIPCILDELKACFNLPKIGTHRIQIGGRIYVIYRCKLSDLRLDKVSKIQLEKIDKVKMQRLIAFRFLLSIPQPLNSSFIFRPGNGEPYSFHESKTLIGEQTVEPTENFIQNWFEDKDFRKTILSVLPKKKEESISLFLYSFQNQIEKVIERVDPNYIWIVSNLVEKIAKLASEIEED